MYPAMTDLRSLTDALPSLSICSCPRAWSPGLGQSSSPEQGQSLELLGHDVLGGKAEPILKHRGIHAAKVGGHLRLAVHKVGKTRQSARDAAFQPRPGQEHGAGCAVVSPR